MEPIEASLKAMYRALLARGLEAGEAANLTAFLHGLPNAGLQWSLPEIEAILRRRLAHAADERATGPRQVTLRPVRSMVHDRRSARTDPTR